MMFREWRKRRIQVCDYCELEKEFMSCRWRYAIEWRWKFLPFWWFKYNDYIYESEADIVIKSKIGLHGKN